MRAHGLLLAFLVVLLAITTAILLGTRSTDRPDAVFSADPRIESRALVESESALVAPTRIDEQRSGDEAAPLVDNSRPFVRTSAGDTRRGSLQVQVLDVVSRRPIAGALVQTKIGSEYVCEFTDDGGALVLHGVGADHANVWIDWRGAPLGFARIPEASNDGAPALASPSSAYADLRRAEPPWRIELLLAARSRVTGRATLDGRPLAQHELSVAPVMGEDASLPRCTTDEEGRFELDDVTSGPVRFHIEASPDDDRANRVHAPLADLVVEIAPEGEQAVELAWLSTDLSSVSGRVVDESGEPVEGVQVLLEKNWQGGEFEGPRLDAFFEERWASVLARPAPRYLPLAELLNNVSHASYVMPPQRARAVGREVNKRVLSAATGTDGRFEFRALEPMVYRLVVTDAFTDEERRDRLILEQPWLASSLGVSGLVDTRVESNWDVGDSPTRRRMFVIVEGTVSVRGADEGQLLPGSYVIAGHFRSEGEEGAPSPSPDGMLCEVPRSSKKFEWFGVAGGDTAVLELWGPRPKGRTDTDEPLERRELKIAGLELRDGAWHGQVHWVVDPPP